MRRLILFTVFLPFYCLIFAQDGPGGVGAAASNRFWLDSWQNTGFNDGDAVQTWTNFGGNANSAVQNTAARQPIYRSAAPQSMNGYPVLSFDGVDDWLGIADNTDLNTGTTSQRSYFLALRTGNSINSRTVFYEEGGGTRGVNMWLMNDSLWFGVYNVANDGPGAPYSYRRAGTGISTDQEVVLSYLKDGNNTTTGTVRGYLDGSLFGTIAGVGILYPHGDNIGLGAVNNNSYFETGSYSSGSSLYFDGEMGEWIHFNYLVNEAQRQIVENYLSAKYDIPLSSNDIYQMDNPAAGNYDHEVAGIGQAGDGSNHTDAQGTGMVRILSPNNLNNNEFLIWGHDNQVADATGVTDLPAGVQSRLRRIWRVTEQGEVGTVEVRFDLTNLLPVTASDLRLLVDTDNDGIFSDETVAGGGVIAGAAGLGGNVFAFFNVAALNDSMRFTLGSINLVQTPLPIEVVNFSAALEGRKVWLDWEIESGADGGVLEIQAQRKDEWEQLAATGPVTKGSGRMPDPEAASGWNHYRLKLTGVNGEARFSGVQSVYLPEAEGFSAYPNPAAEHLFLDFGKEGDYRLTLRDLQGRACLRQSFFRIDSGRLNLSGLPRGVYILSVEGDLTATRKVVH